MNKIILFFAILFFGFSQVQAQDLPYDFEDLESVPIKLQIIKEISTADELQEGQEVKFRVRKNVYCHDTLLIRKNSIINARIETIITKGMNGFPAEIIIGNFKFDGIPDSQLINTYTKTGRSYAILVYPIKWALTPIPFVGSLTNLILGGEAKIKENDNVVIQFYPHWK